jgi:integrase
MASSNSTPPVKADKPNSQGVQGALTPGKTPGKPNKPCPEFPLFPHATGRWAKKIRGKMCYFGPWDDPDGALTKYDEQKEALHAGRTPRPETEGLTVKELVNHFLEHKEDLVNSDRLSKRTWKEYNAATDLLIVKFGKRRLVIDLGPSDFSTLYRHMAKKWGLHRLAKMIQYVRSVFKFGIEAALIDKSIRFGPGFKKPSKKEMRLDRARKGEKLFTADEISRLVDAAGLSLKAMLLLGINCGYGNGDCAALPMRAVNLETGWIKFPRPKTGIERRCPLWPETIEAIKAALAKRHEPHNPAHAELVFITKYGESWGKETSTNPVSQETGKLLKALHINGRKGLGFYTLRHTFRTVADESRDQPAVDFIMGHESPHMSSVYREKISDERLKAVSDYVNKWLFAKAEAKAAPQD